MSDKMFNVLRTLGWLVPMLAVFYGVVAAAFNLPLADQINKVAAGLTVLLNGIVEKSRHDWSKQDFSEGTGAEE